MPADIKTRLKEQHGYGLVEVGLFLVLLAVAAVIAIHFL